MDKRELRKIEINKRTQIENEKAALPQVFRGIGLVGNYKQPTLYYDKMRMPQPLPYDRVIGAIDITSIWKRYLGNYELITKQEKTKYYELQAEIDKLSQIQSQYTSEKATEVFNKQDLSNPAEVKSLESIKEAYTDAADSIRKQINDKIREKFNVLIEPQQRLLKKIQTLKYTEDLEKLFNELITLWQFPVNDFNDFMRYFNSCNESYLSALGQLRFNDLTFFGLDK